MKHQENSSITGKIRSFQRQRIATNITKPVTKYESVQKYQDSAQKGYYNKNYEKHSNHNASKHMLRRTIQNRRNSKNLQKKLAHSSLRKVYVLKRYFWKEAVIGSDLLEQVSISFTKEGVKFNKYENPAQLMQISAENLQEELDLRHVENRQIKKELEKLIQDYKPASTDVTMRIILKDEEPVFQHPRRLAFTERQEVNKQIEEWLNEGIIRPRDSSEYASPIVMVKRKMDLRECALATEN
ncbi:retrovirus-related Pol polyprotein from transposon 412 [Trichonephila clavipes]|nr:retrovirus-related Pol polyprotein from transposon 412 [Trichonephila clavipes]